LQNDVTEHNNIGEKYNLAVTGRGYRTRQFEDYHSRPNDVVTN